MKILVVDDIYDSRYLLEQVLKAEGHDAISASHGVEALQKLRQDRFDAVISDIMMPHMDGFELCHNVKTDPKLKNIPFIFYTATFTSEEDERFALSLGAQAFIVKPQAPEELAARLTQLFAQAPAQPAAMAPRLTDNHSQYLKEYNARLVAKLEEKVLEAEHANRRLNELNESLEARVKLRTSQLEESNHDLEAFAFSIAHDLRGHLRGMTNFAGVLAEDYAPQLSGAAKDCIARIQISGERMNRLIADILAFSRAVRSELKLVPVDLQKYVADAIHGDPALQPPAAHVNVQGDLGHVMGNPGAIHQCLLNLLSNAVKYVRSGVTPTVTVRSESRNNFIRLWVEDNGIGIPADQQANIFQMFHRLHGNDQFEGTGLGLAIVRKAVERMGGKVGVESQPNHGSRFWLELRKAAGNIP